MKKQLTIEQQAARDALQSKKVEEIKPGDVILPPERELRLWMRRHVREKGLADSALNLTVTTAKEGRPDKGGRWIIVRAQHAREWGSNYPFTFKARPGTPWPVIAGQVAQEEEVA